jgi:ATP-binding cassette subfamily B protein
LYIHKLRIPIETCQKWVAASYFKQPLRRRMDRCGLTRQFSSRINDALQDPSCRDIARLDAAFRLVESLISAKAISTGSQAERFLETLLRSCAENPAQETTLIPRANWTLTPTASADGAPQFLLRGAVLVRIKGRLQTPPPPASLSPELQAALNERPSSAASELFRLLRQDGFLAPAVLLGTLLVASSGAVLEALLFRGVLDIGRDLGLIQQRVPAVAALLIFLALLTALVYPIRSGIYRMGRQLEIRFRTAFLTKIPKLGDRYLQSRLTSDMVERSHSTYRMRLLPEIGGELLRSILELLVTVAGIVYLDPPGWWIVSAAALLAIAIPVVIQRPMHERDLRVRSLSGALGRFYLDALLGLFAIKTHGAESAVRREHENLLVEWVAASKALQRTATFIEAVQAFAGFGLAGWLLASYMSRSNDIGSAMLLIFWSLNIPVLGESIALVSRQYPAQRNIALRLLEPLGALEEGTGVESSVSPDVRPTSGPDRAKGVSIELRDVMVLAGGHRILSDVNLEIPSGMHVGIVGPSGAGKSTLVGLLLGWHRAAEGQLLVDGRPLTGERLSSLRHESVWVDPSIQIWNESLLSNLLYGAREENLVPMDVVIRTAELSRLVQTLPDGLQTPLGEGGGIASGGEGQRVRLGRAFQRQDARLAVLDEPMRGLTREQRGELVRRVRSYWKEATLLCVTHDVSETLEFDLVVVIEDGRVVESGLPQALAGWESRYRTLLDAEKRLRREMWAGENWRRVEIRDGQIVPNRLGQRAGRG